jgi:hypothetical protein
MNLHALVCRNPPCGGSRRCRLTGRRYAHSRTRLLHVLHTRPVLRGAAECTRPTVFADRPLLTGGDAAGSPRLGLRAGVAPKPVARSPARPHSVEPHTRALLVAVMRDPLAIGRRRAISDLRLPALSTSTRTPSPLPPAFANDFLGRGRLLPLSGFDTTTTPCLRAAMGDVHHVLRLSLLGWSLCT